MTATGPPATPASARSLRLARLRHRRVFVLRRPSPLTGTLRLGTTPTPGPYLLSPIIAELHRATPGLRLYVREGIPDAQALALSRGGLGLTVLPALYLASDVGGSAGLAILDVAGWKAHRSIVLAWRRGSSVEAACRVIADQVQRSARHMPAAGDG